MSHEIEAILRNLHTKKMIGSASYQTALMKRITKIADGLRWIGGGLFLLVCALALIVQLSHSSNEIWLTSAMWLVIIMSIAALAWIILDMVPSIIFFLTFKSRMFNQGVLEMAHDFAHARDLHQFGLTSLKQAEQWLSIRIDRMKSKLVFIVGGSDKVAVFTIVLGAWTILNNFPKIDMEWQQQTYLLGSALLGGFAIGGMFANTLIKHWSYQKELIAIAVFQLENQPT